MADHNPELPPIPPTAESGPVIDPSPTAVPAEPRPAVPAPPPATSPPWYPDFERPSAGAAAAAGPAVNRPPARPRRRPADTRLRTRAIVGGTSVAAFLAILTGVAVHDRGQPASTVSADNGATGGADPNFVPPNAGGFGGSGSSPDPFGSSGSDSGARDPFSRRFPGGGFSAGPGTPGGSAQTRSHGS